MRCGTCNYPEVQPAVATVERWRGEKLYVIRDVPVERCPQCGEEYFTPAVLRTLERLLDGPAAPPETMAVDVFRFGKAIAQPEPVMA
jgi:YgiT-type zinc finger domain-containing protein